MTDDATMDEPPLELLEALASIGEQRRYSIGGTREEYLLPKDLLLDAWNFCEVAARPEMQLKHTEEQRTAVARLEEAIDRLHRCTELYDFANISDLIERGICWALMRDRAGDVLISFGKPVPE